jgi:hypothetical protein
VPVLPNENTNQAATPPQEGTMESRRNITWVLALALIAIAAMNGCALQNLPLANSGSDVAADRPFNPTHHMSHR